MSLQALFYVGLIYLLVSYIITYAFIGVLYVMRNHPVIKDDMESMLKANEWTWLDVFLMGLDAPVSLPIWIIKTTVNLIWKKEA